MPIYAYQCQGCGQQLEKLQRVSEPALIDCPACGQPELKKLLTAAAFQLKGTGWYETDFKGKKPKAKDEAGKESGGDSGKDSGKESGKQEKAESKTSETAKTGSGKKDAA